MTALAERQREFMAMLDRAAPPADPGLAAYHRSVRANRHDALAAHYPVARRLVGEAFFAAAAEAYAAEHPSTSGDLGCFGAHFAQFLAAYAPASGLGYLADVARLEWAVHECERAAEAAPTDFAPLAAVDGARLGEVRLGLHPAARLVESPHPIAAIWEANQPGCDGSVGEAQGPERVLVHRVGQEARVLALAARDFVLLAALARKATLAEACERLGDDAPRLDVLLEHYARLGVVSGFELPR